MVSDKNYFNKEKDREYWDNFIPRINYWLGMCIIKLAEQDIKAVSLLLEEEEVVINTRASFKIKENVPEVYKKIIYLFQNAKVCCSKDADISKFSDPPFHNDFIDVNYQMGKIYFLNMDYTSCIEALNDQMILFSGSSYYFDKDVDFDEWKNFDLLELWGLEKLIDLFILKAKSEIKLQNYSIAFYELQTALLLKEKIKYTIDKRYVKKISYYKNYVLRKLGYTPDINEIAECIYSRAIKKFYVVDKKITNWTGLSILQFKTTENSHITEKQKCAQFKWKEMIGYESHLSIISDLYKIYYDLEMAINISKFRLAKSIIRNCYNFISISYELEMELTRQKEKEFEDSYTYSSNWRDILGSDDEAGAAFWNLD